MKANEAPEKLYIHKSQFWGLMANEHNITKDGIEYVRKDTFIEKANKWLSINMKMLMNVLDVEYDTHDTDIKDFIEDFKKYIED